MHNAESDKYAIFDLEIVKAIPPRLMADRVPVIEYCIGWKDYANMGISCASFALLSNDNGVWAVGESFVTPWDKKFMVETISDLKSDGYAIGGFNSRKFDDRLLQAQDISFASDFDVLDMVLESAGLRYVDYWTLDPKPTYKLASIVEANGMEKTGRGDLAPIWWQQGERQRVLDYCLNDAKVEAEVLRLLLQGELVDPNTGRKLEIV